MDLGAQEEDSGAVIPPGVAASATGERDSRGESDAPSVDVSAGHDSAAARPRHPQAALTKLVALARFAVFTVCRSIPCQRMDGRKRLEMRMVALNLGRMRERARHRGMCGTGVFGVRESATFRPAAGAPLVGVRRYGAAIPRRGASPRR